VEEKSMQRTTRTTLLLAAATALGAATASAQAAASASSGLDAKAAFERLKQLAGDWEGTTDTKDGSPAQIRYELVSNRSALMETMFPGTDHEMRSVYHMDGSDLVMTHYCALGNQPRMKLAARASKPGELVFDFAGGTNFDPTKDPHVHAGKIRLVDADRIEAEWAFYQGSKAADVKRLFLARKK
jgi:hypothetical protein